MDSLPHQLVISGELWDGGWDLDLGRQTVFEQVVHKARKETTIVQDLSCAKHVGSSSNRHGDVFLFLNVDEISDP